MNVINLPRKDESAPQGRDGGQVGKAHTSGAGKGLPGLRPGLLLGWAGHLPGSWCQPVRE